MIGVIVFKKCHCSLESNGRIFSVVDFTEKRDGFLGNAKHRRSAIVLASFVKNVTYFVDR